jgi:hypothetical protein
MPSLKYTVGALTSVFDIITLQVSVLLLILNFYLHFENF